jgi:hypothetical protein
VHHLHGRAALGRHRGGQGLDGDAGNWRLAGGIDIGQHHFVGRRQRACKLWQQVARARVAMRLEGQHNPRRARGARRGQHGRDFRGMVSIVIDDDHAVDLADPLEAAVGPPEPGQGLGNAGKWHIELEGHGHSGQGIEHRMAPGHLQVQLAQYLTCAGPMRRATDDAAARSEPFQDHVGGRELRIGMVDAVGHRTP